MNTVLSREFTLPVEAPFRLHSKLVKPDSKRRITLGAAFANAANTEMPAYNVYANAIGQIVLDPVRVIPESQVWLFKNKTALQSVKKGLAQAEAQDTAYLGSFAEFLTHDTGDQHDEPKTEVHARGSRKSRSVK